MHVKNFISDNLNFGKRTLNIMFIYNSLSLIVSRINLNAIVQTLSIDQLCQFFCCKRALNAIETAAENVVTSLGLDCWIWVQFQIFSWKWTSFQRVNRQLCKLKLTPTIWNTCRWPRCTLNFLNDAVKVKFKLLINDCHNEAVDMFLI